MGGGSGHGLADRLVGNVRCFPRPVLLSLRNTFRRQGRLALTLSTLTLADAIFVSVLSVRASTVRTLDDAQAYFNYDVELRLNNPYRAERIRAEVGKAPGVAETEVLSGGPGAASTS